MTKPLPNWRAPPETNLYILKLEHRDIIICYSPINMPFYCLVRMTKEQGRLCARILAYNKNGFVIN